MMEIEQHETRFLLFEGRNLVKYIYIHIYEMTMNNKNYDECYRRSKDKDVIVDCKGISERRKT